MPYTWAMWSAFLLPIVVGSVGVALWWWWKGRDEAPIPLPGTFPPPFPPWAAGVIVDERLDGVDWLALVLWLAVRGHVRITREDPGIRILPQSPPPSTSRVERAFYRWLEARGGLVLGREVLRARDLEPVAREVYETLTREGYFAQNPQRVRRFWRDLGVILILSGLLSIAVGFLWNWIPEWKAFALGMILTGGMVWSMAPHMPRKTARGSAVRQYVEDLQRRFARGELPQPIEEAFVYALVLGMASSVVQHLASLPSWWPSREDLSRERERLGLDLPLLSQSFPAIS